MQYDGFNLAESPADPDPAVNNNINTARILLGDRQTLGTTLSQAEALENNWTRLCPDLTKSYISHFPDNTCLLQKRHQAVQSVLQAQIQNDEVWACPNCAKQGQHSRTAVAPVEVQVV